MTKQEIGAIQDLLPRRYQEEIFARAQRANIIAALGTGSGKTFISTLLIKWIATKNALRDKVIVFLVPKVTLVEQQGDFIARHTPLKVLKLHGALHIQMADQASWKKRFQQFDVFVMTAQIFLDLLTHSHWRISKVSLMIFDECHHTRKRHPFNSIMQEYFQTPSNQRPKIFGMTASPISDPKDPVGSLSTLETNLDSKVMAVEEHTEELLAHSPKPAELIREYPPPPEAYDYPSPSLWKCLDLFYKWSDFDIPWTNIETRYAVTMSNLGPYAADLYLYREMRRRVALLMGRFTQNEESVADKKPQTAYHGKAASLLEIDSILSEFQPFFEDKSVPAQIPLTVGLDWCSPKMKVLVDILMKHHSPTFQGIVFVEQRQVAACLARVLPCIPETKDIIRCAELVGQGTAEDRMSKGMAVNVHRDVVKLFRQRSINLLIATSVAEEGLDFPACDIVVRFDSLQHIVGYVQSRGRARNKTSTFIVMIQRDDTMNLSRYQSFLDSEPQLQRVYQSRQGSDQEAEESDEDDNQADIADRERYVVESTGAFLTYDNAINLLNYLCSLIPCDSYTRVHTPKYTGDFQAVLHLPPALPLPAKDLTYTGPMKHSLKEAKRAVAFIAVKSLHALNVFDDYLLPISGMSAKGHADADGRRIQDVSQVPEQMDVLVSDPWIVGSTLYLHPVYLDGQCTSGIITGTLLPHAEVQCDGSVVTIRQGEPLRLDETEDWRKREALREFTKLGIWYCITASPLDGAPSMCLVPLTGSGMPDYETIERLLNLPFGNDDWSMIGEDDFSRLVVINSNQFGLPLLLRGIRHDLSPLSTPPPDSRESAYTTYREYFIARWSGRKRVARVSSEGPLLEVQHLSRHSNGKYRLRPSSQAPFLDNSPPVFLIPQNCSRWVFFSEDMRRAFRMLPSLCHRVTDVYRARQARVELGLPPIADDLLVEAFTLPAASAGYNNQRLETLGDSVLKVCTTVHVFNKYPYRHEGQLSHLRQSCVSNRTLLARAKEIGLERFLTCEGQDVRSWRYTVPASDLPPRRCVLRQFSRRSLQDCMEATLGASFLTGGVPMALRTGHALGLSFGEPYPWSLRYGRIPEGSRAPPLLDTLQEKLGYIFHHSNLLLEAVTHPSFAISSLDPSYQRLEFLGDALLDLVVLKYLYDKFPEASSFQLSWLRSLAICSPALASVGVRRLELHNVMLVNNVELSVAISQCVPFLESCSGEDIVRHGWKHEPPKALSDVLESILGAVLVDSAYDFEKVSVVTQHLMEDVLAALSPTLKMNPISELLEWTARQGCREVSFQKSTSHPLLGKLDSIAVAVHENVISGPFTAPSIRVAKGLASESALAVLKDETSEHSLSRLCKCGQRMEVVEEAA